MTNLARIFSTLALALSALGIGSCSTAPRNPGHADAFAMHDWHLAIPDKIAWQPGPPSLLPGAKMIVLDGDPTKADIFTMRLLLPDGYKVMPHWHPRPERVTVIAGTLNLGMGEKYDATATRPLTQGSFSAMPPGMPHFGWAQGETVLQLTSIGPWQIIYLDPKDDPREAK